MLVAMKAKLLKGAGEAVKKEGKEAAESIAEGGGAVMKGLGSGIEKGLMEVKFTLHDSVAANGLGISRAARGEDGTAQHTITAYITFDRAFTGVIELRAYDVEKREVGRSRIDADEKEGAKYLDFTFDSRTPLMTAGHFELRAIPAQKP